MRESTDITETLSQQFELIRHQSEQFCAPLHPEDYGLQAMPETSPPKWHLAHTTWFFETFVLKPFQRNFRLWHPQFEQLFNSYYNAVGQQFPRAQRGLLSRPAVDEVLEYRQAVDKQVLAILRDETHPDRNTVLARVELGIHHEQQHQELFFSDIKYSFSVNPLAPVYSPAGDVFGKTTATQLSWQEYPGGICRVGYGGKHFCYDNESPAHRVLLQPFALATRLITNREYLHFIEDGGYQRSELWLADAWQTVQRECWRGPLYWREQDGTRCEYTLGGLRPLNLEEPACHLSAYEADAFARWYGARLPTEFEWESCAQTIPVEGQFIETGEYHPQVATEVGLQQMFGTLWEWTSSSYSPYPGFQPATGAIGEYNGKFMCNQLVLRGGSCVSSQRHLRATYRNFFYPRDRWQFSGIRLAKSVHCESSAYD